MGPNQKERSDPKATDIAKSAANPVAHFEKTSWKTRDSNGNQRLTNQRTQERHHTAKKTTLKSTLQKANSVTKSSSQTTPTNNKSNGYRTDPTVKKLDSDKLADKRRKAFNIIPLEDMQSHEPNCFDPKNSTDTPTALKKAFDDNELSKVHDFGSEASQVYSEIITSLPVEDSQHQFTKQPHEIHFGGSDIQHYFNPIYEYTEITEEHRPAFANSKEVTPQDMSAWNIMAVLNQSKTKTFIFTPTVNYDWEKDPVHTTTSHVNMLLLAMALLAQQKTQVKGTLILLVPDPRACEATSGLWDYSQELVKSRRFLADLTISPNFVPLNMISKRDSKEFNVCSAPRPEGSMLLSLENFKEFQFRPPTFSPHSKQLKGDNLLQVESFVLPHANKNHEEHCIDYVRVDIAKDLQVLDQEEALQFFNKIIKPELQDTTSII